MTLAQIMMLALRQLDEDPADISDFRDLFVEYVNEGYQRAVNDYLKPRREFRIIPDDHGDALIDGLNIRSIVSARSEDPNFYPKEILLDVTPDGRSVHIHNKLLWGQPIIITAVVEFPPLAKDTDEPMIPQSAHLGLVDYVCYRYKSTGNLAKQSQAQPYLSQYMTAMLTIKRDGSGSVTKRKNLYEATSRYWPW